MKNIYQYEAPAQSWSSWSMKSHSISNHFSTYRLRGATGGRQVNCILVTVIHLFIFLQLHLSFSIWKTSLVKHFLQKLCTPVHPHKHAHTGTSDRKQNTKRRKQMNTNTKTDTDNRDPNQSVLTRFCHIYCSQFISIRCRACNDA